MGPSYVKPQGIGKAAAALLAAAAAAPKARCPGKHFHGGVGLLLWCLGV